MKKYVEPILNRNVGIVLMKGIYKLTSHQYERCGKINKKFLIKSTSINHIRDKFFLEDLD